MSLRLSKHIIKQQTLPYNSHYIISLTLTTYVQLSPFINAMQMLVHWSRSFFSLYRYSGVSICRCAPMLALFHAGTSIAHPISYGDLNLHSRGVPNEVGLISPLPWAVGDPHKAYHSTKAIPFRDMNARNATFSFKHLSCVVNHYSLTCQRQIPISCTIIVVHHHVIIIKLPGKNE